MGRGFHIPWVGVKILCIGVNISLIGGRHTMVRGFAIPWVEGSKYKV